jgi:hypothetical protein
MNLAIEKIREITLYATQGEHDPLDCLITLREIQEELTKCLDEVKELATEEVSRSGGKLDKYGYNFQLQKGRSNFSFKNISEWVSKNTEVKNLEEKYKLAYRLYSQGSAPVDLETGEVIPIPEVTYSKDTLVLRKS